MSNQVLTQDETDALLDGVSSGAVEVHSGTGNRYADVKPFQFGPHARIQSNSYPRLRVLNQQLATHVEHFCSVTLNCRVGITALPAQVRSFSDHCGQMAPLSSVTSFLAKPLEGHALIILEASAVSQLVEAFFGGAQSEALSNSSGTFTPGEMSVCRLFSEALLELMQQTWEPLIAMKLKRDATEIGTDLVDDIGATDLVIGSRFEMNFVGSNAAFSILLPVNMFRPLIPVLDGQKRERDPAEDARWEQAIRTQVYDADITLAGSVGSVRMRLGDLVGLEPGSVINISNPRKATVLAGGVPVLSGKFGAHSGRNAIETLGWLKPGMNQVDQRKT
jgi:flagellar motor switch protein FliM